MRITPVAHGLDDIVGVSLGPRSPGLHMSDIYGSLFQELEPKRFKKDSAPDPLRFELGLALETVLEKGLIDRWSAERPGEFTTIEGILYTPDAIIFNGSPRLGEIKLTWMSCKDVPREEAKSFPPRFDKWLCQIKAYAYHLELSQARLLAYFVNGANRASPELLAWDIDFTARELKENWQMLLNFARQRKML